MLVSELRQRLADYSFYHIIKLTDELSTPGWQGFIPLQQQVIDALSSIDLAGKDVLDLGCRDGLFSFEAERLGARRMVAIDNDLSRGAVDLVIPFLGSRVEMSEMNVMDLTPQSFGKFDVVICAGLLYHLRYPFWALRLIRDVSKAGGILILETAYLVDDNKRAMLFCPSSEESPHDPTSTTFFNLKGLGDTLGSFDIKVRERLVGMERIPNQVSIMKWREITIDRVCLICDVLPAKNDAQSRDVNAYWHGSHDIHSATELPTGYRVSWLSVPAPASVEKGSVTTLPLTLRNDGERVWKQAPVDSPAAGHTYLTYRWFTADGSTIVELHAPMTPLPHDVALGETVNVALSVMVTPSEAGSYVLELFLAHTARPWSGHQVGAPHRLEVALG